MQQQHLLIAYSDQTKQQKMTSSFNETTIQL